MTAETPDIKLHRGLAGVYIDRTKVSQIDGRKGALSYRGYAIQELVSHSTFEETAYLLIHGNLPNQAELSRFTSDLVRARELPGAVREAISDLSHAHPMDVLRSVVSLLSAFDPDRHDPSLAALRRKAVRLIGQCASAVALHDALRSHRRRMDPDSSLGHTANFLFLRNGEVPPEQSARILDQDFIIHAEHGANASAFAGRVIASTGADFHAAMAGAIACFAGPSHGGAVEGVMRMVEEIARPENVRAYIAERHARREPVMGFGHRVYRTEDPRAHFLRAHAELLSSVRENDTYIRILDNVIVEMEPYARHGVHVNVDFFAAISYALLGLPHDLFTAVFALSRLAGWAAQFIEQYEGNILIRPLLLYDGERNRSYIPLENRASLDTIPTAYAASA
jgi:citrate synthase